MSANNPAIIATSSSANGKARTRPVQSQNQAAPVVLSNVTSRPFRPASSSLVTLSSATQQQQQQQYQQNQQQQQHPVSNPLSARVKNVPILSSGVALALAGVGATGAATSGDIISPSSGTSQPQQHFRSSSRHISSRSHGLSLYTPSSVGSSGAKVSIATSSHTVREKPRRENNVQVTSTSSNNSAASVASVTPRLRSSQMVLELRSSSHHSTSHYNPSIFHHPPSNIARSVVNIGKPIPFYKPIPIYHDKSGDISFSRSKVHSRSLHTMDLNEDARLLNGGRVQDFGTQTETPFSSKHYTYTPCFDKLTNPSSPTNNYDNEEDEADNEMEKLGLSDIHMGPVFNRSLGQHDPEASIYLHDSKQCIEQNDDTPTHLFNGEQEPLTMFTAIPPATAVRPRAHIPTGTDMSFSSYNSPWASLNILQYQNLQHHLSSSVPGTPLSDRSVSTCSKDGSSSAFRYGTLLSSISSPDSKLASFGMYPEDSAFSNLSTQ